MFERFGLDTRLLRAIADCGYVTPTPIQEQALPPVLEGKDVLGLAQTGTGKTAVFALPILQRLLQGPRQVIRALVLAPTRELALQIDADFRSLGRHTPVKTTTIFGGVGKVPQLARLRQGVEVVVACPGRLLDHLGQGAIDLSRVEVLVLDEADRMCDMGFLPDIRRILAKVPAQRQTLFFSATMPEEINQLSRDILHQPVRVAVAADRPACTVAHALYPVPHHLKTRFLLTLLQHTPTAQVLVFTRTKYRARRLAAVLERAGYRSAALQGNMSQNARQKSLLGFRTNEVDILVATDIAARGLDISDISHVINFDMPATVEDYTHRIGRTGRAEAEGEAYTLITDDDLPLVRRIEQLLGEKLNRRTFPNFDYKASPEGAARDVDARDKTDRGPYGQRSPRQRPALEQAKQSHPVGLPTSSRVQRPLQDFLRPKATAPGSRQPRPQRRGPRGGRG